MVGRSKGEIAVKKTDVWGVFNGFFQYMSQRRLSVFMLYVVFFATYGIWGSEDYVTFDAEGFYNTANIGKWYLQWGQLGRWFLIIIKKALHAWLYNPYLSVAMLLICFPLSAVAWGYVFHVWAGADRDKRGIGLFLFGLVYLLHPIYALQFAYRNQMEAISLLSLCMPFAILLLTEYLQHRSNVALVISLIMLICLYGSYQSFMFVSADAFVIFLYLYAKKHYQENKKLFWKMLLKGVLLIGLAFAADSLISYGWRLYFNIPKAAYLSGQFMWGKQTFSENVHAILGYIFTLTFHHYNPNYSYLRLSYLWMAYGILEICAVIYCVIGIIRRRSTRWIDILLLIAVFLVPFTLEIVTAGSIVLRSMFAYVLTLGFMLVEELYWVWDACGTRINVRRAVSVPCGIMTIVFLVMIFGKTTRLLYTDNKTMREDYQNFLTIYHDAMQEGAKEGFAICFIGSENEPKGDDRMFVQDEVIGFGYLESLAVCGNDKMIDAMQAYGFDVGYPTQEQQDFAAQEAESMGQYPEAGSVSVYQDEQLIVVRLS